MTKITRAGGTFCALESLEIRTMFSDVQFSNASYNDIAYDLSANLHVAWYDTAQHTLMYATKPGSGTWSSAAAVLPSNTHDIGMHVAIATDTSNGVGIVFRDEDAGNLQYVYKPSGGSWSTPTTVRAAACSYPSLAYTSDGTAIVSYQLGGSSQDLAVSKKTSSGWTVIPGSTDTTGVVGAWSSLAKIPGTDTFAVAYEDASNGTVKYRQQNSDGTWATPVVVDSALTAGSAYISLAFNDSTSSPLPTVAYEDGADGKLVIADRSGSGSTFVRKIKSSRQAAWQDLLYNSNNEVVTTPAGPGQFRLVYQDLGLDQTWMLWGGNGTSWNSGVLDHDGAYQISAAIVDRQISYTHIPQGGSTLSVDHRIGTLSERPVMTLAPLSPTRIKVDWTYSTTTQTGFSIDRSDDGGLTWHNVGSTSGTARTFTDSTATSGTTYTYAVRASKGQGFSLYSETATATTPSSLVYWDGGAGTSAWTDAVNWSTNTVPGFDYDVVIDVAGSNPTIQLSSDTQTVKSLTLAENLSVSGGTLNVLNTASVTGTLNLAGGTLAGGVWSGNVALTSSGVLDGVMLNSDLTVAASKTLYIQNGLTLGGTLTVQSGGLVNVTNTGTMGGTGTVVLSGGVLQAQNSGGMTLTIGSGVTVRGLGTIGRQYTAETLVNNGTIIADAAGQLVVSVPLTNHGTLRAAAAASTLNVGAASWTNASDGTISIEAGTTFLQGAWSSPGAVSVSGGTLNLNGTMTTAGLGLSAWSRSGGTVNLGGTLTNTGATLALGSSTGVWNLHGGTIAGGTITSGGGAGLSVASSGVLDGVTLNVDMTIPASKTLYTQNGLTLGGTLTIESGGIANVTNTGTVGGTGSVVLSGGALRAQNSGGMTLTIGSGLTVRGQGTLGRQNFVETLVNNGTIIADTAGQLSITAPLTNQGTLRSTAATGTLSVGDITNTGTAEAFGTGAVLQIGGSSSSAVSNTGIIHVRNGASLRYKGTAANLNVLAIDGPEMGVLTSGIPSESGFTNSIERTFDGTAYYATPLSASETVNVESGLESGASYGYRVKSLNASGGQILLDSAVIPTAAGPDRSRIGGVASVGGQTSLGSFTIDTSLQLESPRASLLRAFYGLVSLNDILAATPNSDGTYTLYWGRGVGAPARSYSFVNRWPTVDTVEFGAYGVDLSTLTMTPALGTGAAVDPNADGGNPGLKGLSADPVRYSDGSLLFETEDLISNGLGSDFGIRRGWSNLGNADSRFGNGVISTSLPKLQSFDGNAEVGVVLGGTDTRLFARSGSTYVSSSFVKDTLTHSGSEFIYSDTLGNTTYFYDFSSSVAPELRGQFKRRTDPAGNLTEATVGTNGEITEVVRKDASGTAVESWLFTYVDSGDNEGLLERVQLRRPDGSSGWNVIREVAYDYYTGTVAGGTATSGGSRGDLKTATLKDGSGTTIDVKYYRYYLYGEANGFTHALKYTFDEASFARLDAAVADPFTATDAQVAAFATHYMEYDGERRVTRHDIQGFGGSASDGIGTFTYQYFTSNNATGTNSWRYKTIETLPDGNQNIVFCNALGEVMLKVFKDVADPANPSLQGKEWGTFYKYDNAGRILWEAQSSAITGYDETKADLLNLVSGNYQYLDDDSGLIHVSEYYSSTTASETTAGGVSGYLQASKVQHGELGSPVTLSTKSYFRRTAGGATVSPEATYTVYENANGTGAQTVSYAYTWRSGTTQMQSRTTTLPVVDTMENGSGVADSTVEYFDAYGRPIWTRDEEGFLSFLAYDDATGALLKHIDDVDTTQTGDFSGLPSGWATPSGGGLHLITTREVDGLGRDQRIVDANGNVTYVVYDDVDHEIRTYRGWNGTTGRPTGPTEVLRLDRARSYTEVLTMSALPTLSGGVPTGSEAIDDVESIERRYTDSAGQLVAADRYFSLAGLTYSSASNLGTEGTHFYRATYAYDARGRLERQQNAVGTITRTLYDGMGRASQTWVGTDDVPSSGSWSPSNAGGTNLVKIAENVYDSNDVGDGNLTKTTTFPGGSAAPRVTELLYDWRNRLVSTKSGVQVSEGTDVNRPLTVLTSDNLGRVTSTRVYDADGLSMADGDADGVPDGLSGSTLRARTDVEYDARGNIFQASAYIIDQGTGAQEPTPLVTNSWFDARGNAIKVSAPNGLVTKNKLDGAGRLVVTSLTNGGGDATWSDAGNVSGDVVLRESHSTYDDNGNVIASVGKERFGDELSTATGALGDATTGPKARVTYAASYFDAANRKTADVIVGTNGGASYTRPSSVPTRSDTTLVSSYAYDDAGRLFSTTDPRGVETRSFYDAAGRVTSAVENYTNGTPTNSTNRTTNYTYDGLDHVLTETRVQPGSAPDQTSKYIYGVTSGVHSNDLLARVEYADPATGLADSDNRISYFYNALGETVGVTDQLDAQHAYSYDVLGRRVSQATDTTDGSGDPTTGWTYDVLGNASSVTDALGNMTDFVYDSLGRRLQVVQAAPDALSTRPTTTYEYDAAGNVTEVTDANDHATSYTYDLLSRRLSETLPDPDGVGSLTAPVTTYGYNVAGERNEVTDPLGNLSGADPALHTTKETFDQFGRRASVTGPSPDGTSPAPVTSYAYDRNGNVTGVTDPLSHTTTFVYDDLNRKTSQTLPDPDGAGSLTAPVTSYAYDAQGNLVSVTDPLNRETTYEYDALNRRTKETLPDPDGAGSQQSSVTEYGYDAADNLTTETDPLDQVTTYDYDQLGRQTSQTLPDPDGAGSATSPVTTYDYDLVGNLIEHIDPAGNVTTYEYDDLHRQTSESTTAPQGVVTRSRTYDLVGNVLTITDRNGHVREFTYDDINRQLTEKWLDGSSQVIRTITSAYDAKGRLTSINDPDSSYAYTYDNLDRVATIDNDGTANQPRVVLTLGYDSSGRRASVAATVDSVADFTNAYTFDALDRLTRIEQSGSGVQSKRVDYAYRADGAYDSVTRYSDLAGTNEVATTTYGYDSAGRLTDLTHARGGSTTLADYGWTFDANGRITGFTSPDGSTTYAYDANGQLTAVDNSVLADESYNYDANGNRTSSGYVTDDDNRLTSDGTYNYEYDAEGNRTKRTHIASGDYQEYAYDHRNRLTGITFKDSTNAVTKRVRYTYDALNRRTGKEVDANADNTYESVERYVYDGENIAFVFDGTGALKHRYLHGAGVDDVVAEEDGSGNVSWMLADHQGSVRDVLNSSGTSLDHIVYDSYGNVLSRTGTTTLRYAYTGRELDGETGLHFYRARYYDATVGRFISQDPKGFAAGDGNLYRYVGNSTPNFRDPSGMEADQTAGNDGKDTLEALQDEQQKRDALAKAADIFSKIESGDVAGSSAVGVIKRVREQLLTAGFDRVQVDAALSPYTAELARQGMASAEASRWYNRSERLQGSLSILGNTLTFGGTNRLGITDTNRYHGSTFTGAHAGASVARAGAVSLAGYGVFTGLGAVASGGGTIGTVAAGTQAGLTAGGAFLSGTQIASGVNNIAEGNYVQGTADVYLGTVGAVASVAGGTQVRFPSAKPAVPTTPATATPVAPSTPPSISIAPKPITDPARLLPSPSSSTIATSIKTPYGVAVQESSAAALQMRARVEAGATLYKGGVIGRSETGGSQFLAAENPLAPSYAARYGLPPKNTSFDFVLTGSLRQGAPVITRSAPGIPPNPGGGIEAVVEPGDFVIDSFFMP